ncbi:MAG: hypothetical protein ACHQK9_05875 [Reyranellales bacterium]
MPTIRFGPVIVFVVACLLVGGAVALVVLEPRPPLRHFEVPISSDRFAH